MLPVASKDQKPFLADLKEVHQASTKEFAEQQLDALDEKWGEKYPVVIASWRNNWAKLSTYFKYDPSIRKLIYTTNTIEGFHRQVRKVTKTKGAFPTDMALLKLIYLAYTNIQEKWTHLCRTGVSLSHNWRSGSNPSVNLTEGVSVRIPGKPVGCRRTPSFCRIG